MNRVETLAVAKAVKDAAVKDAAVELAAGEYPVDITVRINGVLAKGEDTTIKPTVAVLSLPVLAKALAYSGITAEAFKVALRKAALEALVEGKKIGDEVAAKDSRVEDIIKEVQDEVIASLPKITRRGAVKFAGEVEVVGVGSEVERAIAA